MPQPRRPRRSRRPGGQQGFTLLEILVVVVIIGVLVTFATLSIGDRALDDRMEVEARRLDQVLKLALEEAEVKGVELGFRHTTEGLEFLAVEDGKWVALQGPGLLRPRPIPEPFTVELRVEGRPVPPALAAPGADKPVEPQVRLYASGELTEFSLELRVPRHPSYYRLDADAMGRFTLERKDAGA